MKQKTRKIISGILSLFAGIYLSYKAFTADAADFQLFSDTKIEATQQQDSITSDNILRFKKDNLVLGLEQVLGEEEGISGSLHTPIRNATLKLTGNRTSPEGRKNTSEYELGLEYSLNKQFNLPLGTGRLTTGSFGYGGLEYTTDNFGFDLGFLDTETHSNIKDEVRVNAWLYKKPFFIAFGKYDNSLRYVFGVPNDSKPALRFFVINSLDTDFKLFELLFSTNATWLHKFDAIKLIDDDLFDENNLLTNNPLRFIIPTLDERGKGTTIAVRRVRGIFDFEVIRYLFGNYWAGIGYKDNGEFRIEAGHTSGPYYKGGLNLRVEYWPSSNGFFVNIRKGF